MPDWFKRALVPATFAVIFLVIPLLVIVLSTGGNELEVKTEAETRSPEK